MLDALNDLGDGEALIITMPPRHSKSESVKAWLEWSLGQHPQDEAILASYAVDLARRHSRSIRNEIAFGNAFTRYFPGVTLAPDSAAATDWALAQGGRFKAAGVGVGITGMGARFGAIDDPFKDRKQAESPVIREGVIDWFKTAFITRLAPNARIVITHTRWHDDDLVGWIRQALGTGKLDDLGGLTWRILDLPAIADSTDDALGRLPGEALWPERYSAEKLRAIERTIGPYDWASVYQQRPSAKGGTVFMDGAATFGEHSGGQTYITVDTAASKRETADFSVLTAWGVQGSGPDAQVNVLECVRGRFDLLELTAHAEAMQGRYGVPLDIEDAGLAKPIIQYMQSRGIALRPRKVSGDKFTRAQPYAAAWNQGRVRLPAAGAPWVGAFRAEHLAFTGTPTDAHDDQVDTGSLLFQILSNPPPAFFAEGM